MSEKYRSQSLEKIAILGGSFDPIHNGHILSAKHVANWLQLKSITLLPAYLSPHKDKTCATTEHRAAMVKLTCQQEAIFNYDGRELARNKVSYTIDTLQEIKSQQPNSQIFFIIGMDSLLNFTRWHQWQDILSLCHLVVNSRPDHPLSELSDHNKMLLKQYQITGLSELANKPAGHIIFSPPINYKISSTEIRANILDNCQGLVPDYVLNYINEQKLYR